MKRNETTKVTNVGESNVEELRESIAELNSKLEAAQQHINMLEGTIIKLAVKL